MIPLSENTFGIPYKTPLRKRGVGGIFILGGGTFVVHERLTCSCTGWKAYATLWCRVTYPGREVRLPTFLARRPPANSRARARVSARSKDRRRRSCTTTRPFTRTVWTSAPVAA
jgi:hypothetical protein